MVPVESREKAMLPERMRELHQGGGWPDWLQGADPNAKA